MSPPTRRAREKDGVLIKPTAKAMLHELEAWSVRELVGRVARENAPRGDPPRPCPPRSFLLTPDDAVALDRRESSFANCFQRREADEQRAEHEHGLLRTRRELPIVDQAGEVEPGGERSKPVPAAGRRSLG